MIQVLESLYQHDLENLMKNYQRIGTLDPLLLTEIGVNIEGVQESLKSKIEGLKDLFWKEFFDSFDKITEKLTTDSSDQMLKTLTRYIHVDFNASNAYAIVIWVMKNANQYFDDQLIQQVEYMSERANISNYTSNDRVFGKDDWRYCGTPEGISHYKLEYRVVLERMGGLKVPVYSWEDEKNELRDRSANFIDDLCTVATNLGFDCGDQEGARSYKWFSVK